MNTKEAIEFLKVEIKCLEKDIEICNPNDDIDIQVIEANKNIIIKYNQVIILLQQGEKYRLMVEEIEKNVFTYGYLNMNGEDFRGMVEMIKDKYFPKETNEYKEGNEWKQ